MDSGGLIQTIVVLAAGLVYLSKQASDVYKSTYGDKKLKSAPVAPVAPSECLAGKSLDYVADLWRWHKPVIDPKTGQPRFMWYEDSVELQEELKMSRDSMGELRDMMSRVNESISKLVTEIRSQTTK